MPQRIICSKCSAVLYEGMEVIQPIDILVQYNSICPNCGKKLNFELGKVAIALNKVVILEASAQVR